jgi:hypothetical protein
MKSRLCLLTAGLFFATWLSVVTRAQTYEFWHELTDQSAEPKLIEGPQVPWLPAQ